MLTARCHPAPGGPARETSMDRCEIEILEEPRVVSPRARQDETRQAAWRWRYCDPRSGELVDPSEPMTPAEMLSLNPSAELIPGTRTLLPVPLIQLWR